MNASLVHSVASASTGAIEFIARPNAQASTPSLATALIASTALPPPNTFFRPLRGSSRARSGARAAPWTRNLVCANTPAMPARPQTAAKPSPPTAQAVAARRNASAGATSTPASIACRRWSSACDSAGTAVPSMTAAAARPASDTSSRESGAWPSSRARSSLPLAGGLCPGFGVRLGHVRGLAGTTRLRLGSPTRRRAPVRRGPRAAAARPGSDRAR